MGKSLEIASIISRELSFDLSHQIGELLKARTQDLAHDIGVVVKILHRGGPIDQALGV